MLCYARAYAMGDSYKQRSAKLLLIGYEVTSNYAI